ncbi:Intradiol ring-cleavage dioxygenase [Truncatella angustata]|uniref:Intradiol ring-cleavage dioxygenase n=1 Tax=Truncatella angustata TaxID=152316 RepID=A0A9P8UW72_9PEZI|nr:Intradiol ring-cleavage dioxygenase [Truncatella angustata]KAH6659303.1 Intradiol ring-cleavage dioxygenase [Truncatella angustata]
MGAAALAIFLAGVLPALAHPEVLTPEKAKREASMIGRSTGKCAAAIEARKADVIAKRSQRLIERRVESGSLKQSDLSKRNELKYTTIQNDTCVLAPDTVWGPYGIDGEIIRHDLREISSGQSGLDFYLDIGVIDIETCEPLPNAALTIWNCNSTGTYSGFTGIDPDTASIADGWSTRSDGTTDDETFLRGIQITDEEGMAEFLTLFPGYYTSRTTHVHVTVQTNITNGTSYSSSAVQHIGQLFFNESLINSVYELAPYADHLATLNRTTNDEDKLFATATSEGYSAVVSVDQIGDSLADGLVGYITIGVNVSAEGLTTTGGSVNVIGSLPTVSVASSKYAEASAVDIADGYTS